LSRHVAPPRLPGPWWPPPPPHRRLLARDGGRDGSGTRFSRARAALQTSPPGSPGTSRATDVCVALVVHPASDFTGAAQIVTQRGHRGAQEQSQPSRTKGGGDYASSIPVILFDHVPLATLLCMASWVWGVVFEAYEWVCGRVQ